MKMDRFSRVLATLALAAILAVPAVSAAQIFGGTLRVANNSAEVLNVNVDGVMLGVAPPGQVAQFMNVPAGFKSIALMNQFGQLRSSGRFFLGANALYTWTVAPPAMVAPVMVVQPVGGTVQVMNRFSVPANVTIGRRLRGTVFPGQTAAFYNIRPGLRPLFAANAAMPTQELFRQEVNVIPGATQYVNLVPQVGILRLANSRPEPVEIVVDGQMMTLVQPGQTLDLPNVMAGNRNLQARVAGQIVQTAVAPVFPGQFYTWYIRATFGTIRIINRGFEPLSITINGAPQGVILPSQDRFIPNVAAGAHKLLAMAPDGAVRNAMDLVLGPGETRMWVLASAPPHEPHPHIHAHPHAASPHHHHEHLHPHPPGLGHHHPY